MTTCIPLLLLTLAPGLQEAQEPDPLPPGVVARVGDRDISLEEYKDFLWQRLGKRAVQELAGEILLEAEAARYGIKVDQAAVDALVQEREEAARAAPRQREFEEDLRRGGQSLEMFRAAVKAEVRADYLLGELVRATRVVTDQRVQMEFEAKHGTGGLQQEVAHVLLMPNILRAEKLRAGTAPNEIDLETLRRQARELADQALAQLKAGEEFAAVAADLSHDQTSKDAGGKLRTYNGRLYGDSFSKAVAGLEVGEFTEVVETPAGFHVIKLLSRKATKLADVRAELIQEIEAAEPTWQEKSTFRQALISKSKIQLW